MTDQHALRHCYFCHKEVDLMFQCLSGVYYVACLYCAARGPIALDGDAAARGWNAAWASQAAQDERVDCGECPSISAGCERWKCLHRSTPAAHPMQDEREAFEVHHAAYQLERQGDDYLHLAVQAKWEAWQARGRLAYMLAIEQAAPGELEEALERAYWEFDAARAGLGEYKGRPQAERDAFKAKVRWMLSHYGSQK